MSTHDGQGLLYTHLASRPLPLHLIPPLSSTPLLLLNHCLHQDFTLSKRTLLVRAFSVILRWIKGIERATRHTVLTTTHACVMIWIGADSSHVERRGG
jgi:hypothetical protein